jgi:predicted nucleic acid-binding protein
VRAFILDASLALEWFTSNASPQVLAKRELLDTRVALVPHIWRFEVMNVVTRWLRRGDISEAGATLILNDVLALPFAIVDEGDPELVVSLATAHDLSAYDAAYLRAAMITGEPLATLDSALLRAADTAGVPCV